MSVNRIATRYAKSLLDLARETDQVEAVRADMQTFGSALQSRDFVLLLKSPMVHADKKIAIMEAIFEGKLSRLTLDFLRICARKGREAFLTEIAAAFETQYRSLKNILSARLVTATAVEPGLQEELAARIRQAGLAGGEIQWETRVDPELIGGFVLELGDLRYDASVARQLDQLRKEVRQKVNI
jgi:F-type H+-transporting ATPase subunit delta